MLCHASTTYATDLGINELKIWRLQDSKCARTVDTACIFHFFIHEILVWLVVSLKQPILHPKTKITAHPSCDQNIFCNRAGRDTYFTVFFDTLCPKLLICFYVCSVMKVDICGSDWKML